MVQEIWSFDAYEAYINRISEDPSLRDPHYAFDKNNLYGALKDEHQRAFIVTSDGTVRGLFVWQIIPEEKYIEMMVGLSDDENAVAEMLSSIEGRYMGYQLDIVINPENECFCNVLQTRGAAFDEEQQWMTWQNETDSSTDNEIVQLSSQYETQYIDIHSKDGYWTAEKVIEAKDCFRTFLAIREEQVIGYIDVTYSHDTNEIYDLWVDDRYRDKHYAQALIHAATAMNKPKEMMVLVDLENAEEVRMYESAGFVTVEGTKSVYGTYYI